MGRTRFDETWWTKGHGMFGAHEEDGLIGAEAAAIKIVPIIVG
jgi:hypothetical protein